MNEVGRYIQVHLTGAAAGIDLFHLSGRRITDPAIRETVKLIHTELVDERRRLVRMAEDLGAGDPRVLSLLTRLGAQATRLGPNGNWMRRTTLSTGASWTGCSLRANDSTTG